MSGRENEGFELCEHVGQRSMLLSCDEFNTRNILLSSVEDPPPATANITT